MSIDLSSPIVGQGGDHDAALSYAYAHGASRYADLIDYADELNRLCRLVGFDFRILFAQAWHETAGFTSHWWRARLNPAGIGITGDPAQNAASHTWANGTDASRAHVIHMLAYTGKIVLSSDIPASYLDLDPRWQAVFDAGYAGTVKRLGDLGNGKWATDPNYATKIAAVANRIFTEEPIGCWWPGDGRMTL